MKLVKSIKLIIIIAVAVVAAMVVGRISGLLPDFGVFSSKKLTIGKTANVIDEVKKISELTTACFFLEESLIDRKYAKRDGDSESGNVLKNLFGASRTPDSGSPDSVLVGQIAFIIQGKVRAGFDLSALSEESFDISGDTVSVKLPQARIFDVIVNPTDVTEFDRSGDWSEEEIANVLGRAKEEVERDALDFGILEKARSAGKDKVKTLFTTFGFNHVIFR